MAREQPLLHVRSDKSRDVLRLEEELADAVGATVEARVKKTSKHGGQSGELAVQFDSPDPLSGIFDKLRGVLNASRQLYLATRHETCSEAG